MSFLDRMKTGLDMLSSVAVIAAVAILSWVIFFDQPAARSGAQEPLVATVSGLSLDASHFTNARGQGGVVVVEFSDFQCPFCANYAFSTLPVLNRDFIEKGRVKYVAMHYPIEAIHPLAVRASEASECAARQGRFWEMRDRLFRDSADLEDARLVSHAKAISLDVGTFELCLKSHETIDKIRSDQAEGKRLGIIATPSFLIGTARADGSIDLQKHIRGVAPAEVFVKEIEELLGS